MHISVAVRLGHDLVRILRVGGKPCIIVQQAGDLFLLKQADLPVRHAVVVVRLEKRIRTCCSVIGHHDCEWQSDRLAGPGRCLSLQGKDVPDVQLQVRLAGRDLPRQRHLDAREAETLTKPPGDEDESATIQLGQSQFLVLKKLNAGKIKRLTCGKGWLPSLERVHPCL